MCEQNELLAARDVVRFYTFAFASTMCRTGMCTKRTDAVSNCEYTAHNLLYVSILNTAWIKPKMFADYGPDWLQVLLRGTSSFSSSM